MKFPVPKTNTLYITKMGGEYVLCCGQFWSQVSGAMCSHPYPTPHIAFSMCWFLPSPSLEGYGNRIHPRLLLENECIHFGQPWVIFCDVSLCGFSRADKHDGKAVSFCSIRVGITHVMFSPNPLRGCDKLCVAGCSVVCEKISNVLL